MLWAVNKLLKHIKIINLCCSVSGSSNMHFQQYETELQRNVITNYFCETKKGNKKAQKFDQLLMAHTC